MPKKTSRPAKSSQQRAREEQWRRRVSAQGLTTVDGPTATMDNTQIEEGIDEQVAQEAPTRTMTATRPRQAATTAATRASSATSQRRTPAASAARASRLRPAASYMSIDEEMYYVRNDIRRLIILTAICMAVLIALSFVIR